MTTLVEIEEAILRLPNDDFKQLAAWLVELDQQRWDEELERDVAVGKLDALGQEALREHRAVRIL